MHGTQGYSFDLGHVSCVVQCAGCKADGVGSKEEEGCASLPAVLPPD